MSVVGMEAHVTIPARSTRDQRERQGKIMEWERDMMAGTPTVEPNPHYLCGTITSPPCPTGEHTGPYGCDCGVRSLGSWYVTLHVLDPATGLYDYVERFACSVRHRDAFIAAHRDDPAVELIEFEEVKVL